MKVLLYDFRWRDETQCEFEASVGDNFGKKAITIGDKISLAVCSRVRCAGSLFEDEFKPCPQNFEGKYKCDICRAREKSFVFTAFDGFNTEHISEEDLSRIAGEHVVYLAFFSNDLIKVGVSKLERKTLRQIEQGSHYTLYIAKTPDGIAARQIETLFRQTGLADKIKPSQKKEFLIPEISPDKARQKLEQILSERKQALGEYPSLGEFFIEPEFCEWEKIYGLDKMAANTKPLHFVKLEEGESLSGEIVAIKGQFLMIETDDEMVAICVKDLYGREIDFSDIPMGLSLKSAMQKAMF